MRRTLLTAIAVALLAGTAAVADTTFKLTGDNTKVTFIGTKPGGKHDGGFKTLAGTATVDAANPSTLKLEATIETDSLYSDDAKLTGHLKNPDFFAVKDHPKATFKSTKVVKTATGYSITGDLTLLGKTKAVTMPAAVTATPDGLVVTSEFKINRSDWGMTYGKGKVNDDVSIKLNVNAKTNVAGKK